MSTKTKCEFCNKEVKCNPLYYDSYCNIYSCKKKNNHIHKLCVSCEKEHQEALEWFDCQYYTSINVNKKKR
jgi:hypothetical protein